MAMSTFKESSLTSATTGTTIKTSRVMVVISGTWSATVKFKWTDEGGTAHYVQENGADLSFTANGERVLDFGVPVTVQPEVTAYTSGTVVIGMQGSILAYP